MPSAPNDPTALIVAAQRGERSALRKLVREHQGAVGGLLRRMLGPVGLGGLTEDLAQETFLRAFRALGRFDPEGPARFSTWVLKIAARLAINELARKRPRIQPDAVLVDAESPEREHDRRRVAAAIEAAVAELPPPFRAAFVLREYHGLDYAEIAKMLDLELGTVKSRLSRARRLLRDRLKGIRS
ncbi:MAG: sigma-70 family RNA polymerase sigma factor [Myxococcota bacterium]